MIFLRQNTHALLVVLLFFLSRSFFPSSFPSGAQFFFSLPYHRQSFVKEARSWKIIFNRRQTRFSKETTKIDLISKQRRNNKHKETCLSTHLIRYLDFILLSLSNPPDNIVISIDICTFLFFFFFFHSLRLVLVDSSMYSDGATCALICSVLEYSLCSFS